MEDLIPRAAAIEICKSVTPNTNPDFYNLRSKKGYGCWMHSNGEAVASTSIQVRLENLPAVDAVPVVRCKDCQHRGSNKICVKLWVGTKDNFFCGFGERRNNE